MKYIDATVTTIGPGPSYIGDSVEVKVPQVLDLLELVDWVDTDTLMRWINMHIATDAKIAARASLRNGKGAVQAKRAARFWKPK